MKICLDAREVREITTGIGRYSLNLVQHIARLDRENEYIVLQRPACPHPFVDQENFRTVVAPYGISHIRNVISGASVINPLQADIYHALHHFLPFGVSAGRIVITLHDLIWVTHAHLAYESRWLAELRRRTAGPFVGRSAQAADHIIAISESTRQAALTHYDLPARMFTVIHHGVDPAFHLDLPPASLPEACQGRRFIFSLGNTKPYKNIPRMLQAFSLITRRYPDLFLVVSGRGDSYPTIARLSRDFGISEKVILTGQLSDEEVRACFAKAALFAFPSLIEGFGLPALEAMVSGCPVLTSNAFSLPEIAGDAALLVDPLDVDGIATGMCRLLDDERLRQDLIRKGRQWADPFTWQACAEKTLMVYDRLMSKKSDAWASPPKALRASQKAS